MNVLRGDGQHQYDMAVDISESVREKSQLGIASWHQARCYMLRTG